MTEKQRAQSEAELYLAANTREVVQGLIVRIAELEKDLAAIRGRPGLPGILERLQKSIQDAKDELANAQLASAKGQGKRLEDAKGEREAMKADIARLKESQTDTKARLGAGLAVLMGIISLGLAIAKIMGQ